LAPDVITPTIGVARRAPLVIEATEKTAPPAVVSKNAVLKIAKVWT
jgi:hypothetical protein